MRNPYLGLNQFNNGYARLEIQQDDTQAVVMHLTHTERLALIELLTNMPETGTIYKGIKTIDQYAS